VKRDTVSVETLTHTVHTIHVDLRELLGTIDVTDGTVQLVVETPSGRAKRVQIPNHLLVERRDW
jgi:hypothetical protein